MIRWSEEQRLAIDRRRSNILLSAAAGSGKTSVLTQRVIELMEDGDTDIDRFLIFTFTRAAAANMKDKIMQKIVAGLENPERGPFYREQLARINQASIVTIHSFCNTIIRENFYLLGIDPNFSVMEDNRASALKDAVLSNLFETRYAEEDSAFLHLVETYSDSRDDRKLMRMVLELHEESRNQPDFEAWCAEMLRRFGDADLWLDALGAHLERAFEQALMIQHRIRRVLEAHPVGGDVETFFEKERDMITQAAERNREDIHDFPVSFATLRWPKGCDESVKSQVNALRKRCKDSLTQPMKRYYGGIALPVHQAAFERMIPVVRDLLGLVGTFEADLQAAKRAQNVLEYADLEHYTLELLRHDDVARRYAEAYAYVFVDEYQDSSHIQEAIIQRIVRRDNLFMVGDLKQSIYKFRSAVPEIFANKYRAFSREEQAVDFKLDLSRNYRSRKNILDFINRIFTGLMTDDFGGMAYDEMTRLYHGNTAFTGEDPPVEIRIVEGSQPGFSRDELEVHEIAGRLLQLHGEEGIAWGDIVIIMRSPASYAETFNRIFAEHGIPFLSNKSYEFADTLEVQQLIHFLTVIDNPRQDIPLASLMRAPVFGFSDDDLARIRCMDRRVPFSANVLEYPPEGPLGEKISRLRSRLEQLRLLSRHLPLGDLLWRIYTEEGYEAYFAGLPGAAQREANVRLLIRFAAEAESAHAGSLSRFLGDFSALSQRGRLEGAPSEGEASDAVRLLSIHGSKGLEFPVVVLAGLAKGFNISDAKGDVVVHREWGVLSKSIDPQTRTVLTPFHRDLVQEKLKRDLREEEMRLLYTALTRAEERLLLFASVRDAGDDRMAEWKEGSSGTVRELVDNHLDWIMSQLYEPKSMPAPKLQVERVDMARKAIARGRDARHWDLPALIDDLASAPRCELPDPFVPEWRSGPAKVSVTEIAHQTLSPLDKMEMKRFSRGGKTQEISAAELGTQLHRVIQWLKLDRLGTAEMFHGQIETMKEFRLIHENLEEMFDLDRIRAFFDSPLGVRLMASSRVYRERPFVLKEKGENGNVLVQGIIDCYFIEDGKAVLIDFKSDRIDEGHIARVMPQYATQLDYYARAIEKLTGIPVSERYVHFIRTNDSHRVSGPTGS